MEQGSNDLPRLAAPAQRALQSVGITELKQLTRVTEAELSRLHGMGPNALARLRQALKEKGWSFAEARELSLSKPKEK